MKSKCVPYARITADKWARREERRAVNQQTRGIIDAGHFDAYVSCLLNSRDDSSPDHRLVIATKFHPEPILKRLYRHLGLSRSFVVYCQHVEVCPLPMCLAYDYLTD